MSIMSVWRKIFGSRDKERREFIRLGAHHLIKYKKADMPEAKELSFIRDIGAGGVLFYSVENFPPETILDLEINFPHYPHSIIAIGKVLRSKPLKKVGGFEVAVEFVKLSDEARQFINDRIVKVSKAAKKRRK